MPQPVDAGKATARTAAARRCFCPTFSSTPARTEALGASCGRTQFLLCNFACQEWMFEELRDFVAFPDRIGLVAQILHKYDHFAAVAGINHARIAHQAFPGYSGSSFHHPAGRRGKLDSDAGVDTTSAVRGQSNVFCGIEIVANVFSRVCYCGQHSVGCEFFHLEHVRSLCQMTTIAETNPQVPYFDEAAVRRVLRYEDLIPAMEQALADFSSARVLQPVRTILPVAEHQGFLGMMPAVYGEIMGAKLVTLYPHNAGTDLPTHQAIIVLLRATTGEPLAVLDGRLITEMRTAAVTAVATKHLSAPDSRTLAILGSGVQARAHIAALRCVRDFSEVRLWSRTPSNAQSLANEMGAKSMSAEAAVRDAEVVVTATNASKPVLMGRWLKPGALVNAVGAVGATNREVDDSVMQGAVIVDSRAAAQVEAGEILMSGAPIYAELGEIVACSRPKPRAERVVFKSLGLAVEDLAAAKLVLERLGG